MKFERQSNGPALKEFILQNNPESTFTDLGIFSALTALEKIVMKSIDFTGAFRTDLSLFPNLQSIDLSENKILRFEPTNIPNTLKTIDLRNNLIIKFEKPFLQTLTQLDITSLSINVKCKQKLKLSCSDLDSLIICLFQRTT